MELLENIIEDADRGQPAGNGVATALAPVLMTLLTNNQAGGPFNRIAGSPLSGLLDRFEQAGLGSLAQSWVGTGPNQPVTADQLHNVLGRNEVQGMAQETGMTPQTVLAEVARVLPDVIDRLTPNGELPSHEDMAAPNGAPA